MFHQDQRKEEPSRHVGQAESMTRPNTGRVHMAGSPVKRRIQQPLTIRMNLTEGQMNKLTEAVDDSPKKQTRALGPKSISPLKDNDRSESDVLPVAVFENVRPSHPAVDKIPEHVENKLLNEVLQCKTTLAKRRNLTTPSPIKTVSSGQNPMCSTEYSSKCLENSVFPEDQEVQDLVTPESSSSYYEKSTNLKCPVGSRKLGQPVRQTVEEMSSSWADVTTPDMISKYPQRQQSLAHKPRQSQNVVDNQGWPHISSTFLSDPSPYLAPRVFSQNPNAMPPPSSQNSPLPLHFRGQGYPSTKRGEKTMIGCNGWLESTERSFEFEKKPQSKRFAFIDSIKRMAKDVTAELNPSFRRQNGHVSDLTSTQLAISLDAREQSLLYCELEFHLTSALNDYLVFEFEKGHLVADNLKKISDSWIQRGRPRVISFRYDLETQLELVALHLNEFSFYGRRQSNPAEISGLLHAMKINARAIRVRTFCQPDSVIAKQLVDAQSLFNLINVSRAPQLALAEIAHFFKTIVEREVSNGKRPVRDDIKTSLNG
ncbi:hypothetical protein E4U43_001769 [Claviceps pusilla]|uniref:Uncharacterized protein n=1 Tax=Claviceps pusilla TaxID=123648 RepID=A0A9P7NHW9_9HYPO|nr:hypothetical protein E4U43_001769 [Claviceps pusilla]